MAENILDRISRESANLSKGERSVAKIILDDPLLSAGENIAELATRAGVSQPTVCRFCTRFGASGFREFKLILNAAVRQESNPVQNKSIKSGDTVNDVIKKVFSSVQAALQDTERNIDPNVLARAIDLVSQAGRIVLAAHGTSKSSAEDFLVRLLSLGMHAECYADNTNLLRAAASLHAGDLLIIISSTGEDLDFIHATKLALDSTVSTMALCPATSTMSQLCSLSIKCGYKSDNSVASMTGQIAATVVLQSIIAGVTLRRADLIKAVGEKIEQAVLLTQKQATRALTSEEENKTPVVTQAPLNADTPITVINWKS